MGSHASVPCDGASVFVRVGHAFSADGLSAGRRADICGGRRGAHQETRTFRVPARNQSTETQDDLSGDYSNDHE